MLNILRFLNIESKQQLEVTLRLIWHLTTYISVHGRQQLNYFCTVICKFLQRVSIACYVC